MIDVHGNNSSAPVFSCGLCENNSPADVVYPNSAACQFESIARTLAAAHDSAALPPHNCHAT
jgi:hypothetical protein